MTIHSYDNDKDTVLRELTAVTQDDIAHIADTETIDHDHAGLHASDNLSLFLRELEDLTVLTDEDIFLRHTEFACKACVLHEVMVFAVHGHKELRTHEIVHELEFLAAAVPRDVNALVTPIDDVRTELHQIVHRLRDELLVARDRRRRDDNCIARHNRNLAVIGCRHARERRHRLTLTARRHDDDLLGTEVVHLIDADDRPLGCCQIAQIQRDADHILHAAPEYGNTPLILDRRIDNLLDAVDIR